jgi:hypothetical protein
MVTTANGAQTLWPTALVGTLLINLKSADYYCLP